ncbi:acylphosphatase [Aliterella atlantica]
MRSSQMDNLRRCHIFVSGRVQKVGFRYAVLQAATKSKVNGWVRNLPDGRVEAVFEGNSSNIEQMLLSIRQVQHPAEVKDIILEYQSLEGIQGFEIRR